VFNRKEVKTMHYHCEIYLDKKPANKLALYNRVAEVMAPYEEQVGGWWDWWQIGGRWSGIHTNYDPNKDERNIEVCSQCEGSGMRMDAIGRKARRENPEYTCNGCDGKVTRPVWPTNRAMHEGDVISVSEIKDNLDCYTLIINDSVLHEKEWNGKDWNKTSFDGKVAKKLAELKITEGFLVTVDYHC
jgi:hypothetical protein